MVNATNETNVSQKQRKVLVKIADRLLSEEEVQVCLSKGGIILPSGSMAMPLSEQESITRKFRVRSKNAEKRFMEAYRNINGGCYDETDIKFVLKEGSMNLRTIYGIYLSMCNEEGIEKVITWRTFYMQCSGYRTMKPNTMRSVAKYVAMESKSIKVVVADDTITL